MTHKTILFLILSASFIIFFCFLIKNRPQYLLLLGIRGLLSFVLIGFLNDICTVFQISSLIQENPVTVAVGSLLGFPGILLMYLSKLYLLS